MKPLVSVIITVYNVRGYVAECLESVCGQSYENLEIIVVDDGSTDGSGEVCDEFAKKDKRVKVFHKKNGGPGPSSARNFGLRKATGEEILFVDSDDSIRKDCVMKMLEAIGDADIVMCGYNDVVPNGMAISGREATERLLIDQDNLEVVVWGKLYRKWVFDGIQYPEGEKYEDSLTAYKVLVKARTVVYLSESLYEYRKREGSIMDESVVLERLRTRERAAREAVEYFADDKDLKQAAEVAVLTSKYAFVDAAIRGDINMKYYTDNRRWILKHRKQYADNKYLTRKLRAYNIMIAGFWYKIFRKMRNE